MEPIKTGKHSLLSSFILFKAASFSFLGNQQMSKPWVFYVPFYLIIFIDNVFDSQHILGK